MLDVLAAVSEHRARRNRVPGLCDGRQQPIGRAGIGCCRQHESKMQVCELKTDRDANHVSVAVPWIPCYDETGRLQVVRKCDDWVGVTIRETVEADVRGSV